MSPQKRTHSNSGPFWSSQAKIDNNDTTLNLIVVNKKILRTNHKNVHTKFVHDIVHCFMAKLVALRPQCIEQSWGHM